MAEPKRTR